MTASFSPVLPDPDTGSCADRCGVVASTHAPASLASPEAGHVYPLRTRHIGIFCDDPQCPRAVSLQRELSGLGARVALVRTGTNKGAKDDGLEPVAHILSRLYDAVVCVGLDWVLVSSLRDAAGIPVLSGDEHVDATPEAVPPEDKLLNDLVAGLRP